MARQFPTLFQNSRLIGKAVFIVAVLMLMLTASPRVGIGADRAMPVAETAAVVRLLNYQGRLLDPDGAPQSGTFALSFRIYDVASGGTPLWTETKDVPVADGGLFNTRLGDTTTLPTTLFNGQDLWLAIKVGADAEATPRQQLLPVAYALYADNADRLDGQDGAFYQNAGNINAGTLADGRIAATLTRDTEVMGIVTANDGANSGVDADLLDGKNSTAYVSTTGPNTIAGNNNSNPILSVTQSGSQNGVFATTASTDFGEAALNGRAGAAGPTINSVAGVFGSSATGRGVIGSSTDNDGVIGFSTNGTGVDGQSANGNGVEGLAVATSGVVYGVHGTTNSPGGAGVYGYNSSNGIGVRGESADYIGVWGKSDGAYGIYGRSNRTSGSYGIYGSVASGTNTYAGYFNGNVNVNGVLSKSSGSFKIDHPLDPENKYLYHSFVESPDMMNVYNGNVTLDANGEAWVQLPNYFEALNKDFRYQLTPIGGPGPNLYIAEQVQGNTFKIAGGAPNLQVSWQVTGIRQDPYANANRIAVEEDKPEAERGTYLHPDEYGQDYSLGLNYQLEAEIQSEPSQQTVTPLTTDAVVQQ